MTRDQEPMADDALGAAKEEIHAAFDEVRNDLEEDLDEPVPDGGE